jgi:hypothetical protein
MYFKKKENSMVSFKKIFKNNSMIVLCSLLSVSTCYAQYSSEGKMEEKLPSKEAVEPGESTAYMGISGGINSPVGDVAQSPEASVAVGFFPVTNLDVGAEVSSARLDDSLKRQRTTLVAKTAYKIGGDTPVVSGTYLGVGAGPTMISDKLEWAVAPVVGIDLPLSEKKHNIVSLGLNAKYVGMTNSPDSYVGSAALKYWY